MQPVRDARVSAGRAVHHGGGGGRHLHDDRPLAGEPPLLPHPLPAPLLQTRHQAAHPRPRAPQGGIQVRTAVPLAAVTFTRLLQCDTRLAVLLVLVLLRSVCSWLLYCSRAGCYLVLELVFVV